MACTGKIIFIWGSFLLISLLNVNRARNLLVALVCKTSSNPIASGFIQTRDTHFVLNESPFLFNGFNSYWMMQVAVEPSERYKISNVFREASAVGLNVCRTWAFSDGGYQPLQISPGVYDELVFQVKLIVMLKHVYACIHAFFLKVTRLVLHAYAFLVRIMVFFFLRKSNTY